MAKQTLEGECNLCHTKLDKSRITRHLDSCLKERASGKSSKTTSFRIMVEGRYAPEYWMCLQARGDATLYELDALLRETWLECCGHLSEFRIGNKTYAWQPDHMGSIWNESDDEADYDDEAGDELTSEQMQRVRETFDKIQALFAEVSEARPELMAQALLAGPDASDEELKAIFAQLGADSPDLASRMDKLNEQLASFDDAKMAAFKELTMAELFEDDSFDDDSFDDEFGAEGMDIKLDEALKRGTRFRHEYDFGSTTQLNLRVAKVDNAAVGNRPVTILARNLPPPLTCSQCGEPAEVVCTMCGWMSDQGFLCHACYKKHDCQGDGPDVDE